MLANDLEIPSRKPADNDKDFGRVQTNRWARFYVLGAGHSLHQIAETMGRMARELQSHSRC